MRVSATVTVLFASLALAAPAAAGVTVGVVDDRGKHALEGDAFFAQLNDVGMTENRVTVLWDPAQPTAIPEADALARLVGLASPRGIRPIFAVYPAKARAIADSPAAQDQFVAFLRTLAAAHPQVKDFIVGNEPNQTRFWQPQFNANGSGASCVAYERLLAASYDALKSVDPAITVVGVGLSPRGNDDPKAKSNISTSPVRCLRDMGAAYRGSARNRPIMDEFSFHPYPKTDTDSLLKGYRWPNAGVPNLDRIKQAVWDAFGGTAQPTFEERGRAPSRATAANPLRFRLDEVGWQVGVVPSAAGAYFGAENVRVTDEASQAQVYGQLVPYLACDPSVRSVLLFGLFDEPDLERWQAGLVRADGTKRASYDAVKNAIAQTGGRCAGKLRTWRHATRVLGAAARFPASARWKPVQHRYWAFSATAEEDALFTAGVFRASTGRAAMERSLARGGRGAALRASGKVNAYWTPLVKFPGARLERGKYVFAIRLAVEMNSRRTTMLVSRPFQVGHPGRR